MILLEVFFQHNFLKHRHSCELLPCSEQPPGVRARSFLVDEIDVAESYTLAGIASPTDTTVTLDQLSQILERLVDKKSQLAGGGPVVEASHWSLIMGYQDFVKPVCHHFVKVVQQGRICFVVDDQWIASNIL